MRLSDVKAGDVVLSHTVSHAVPSAQRGLTTVFGMGTGVTLAAKPPTKKMVWVWKDRVRIVRLSRERLVCEVLVVVHMRTGTILLGLAKPLGRLVLLG